jgi:hypothetical protein
MPKANEPPAIVRISTNTILGNRFFNAYEPLPVASVEDLPENLRPLVVTSEPEAEEPNVARGSFQTGVIYEMTEDGRLGRIHKRKVERQVAELEAAAQEDEWIEEQLDAPLPPEIAESLQEEHEDAVALAKAQLAADARRSDEASDAAATAAEPPQLYVKRGVRHYAPAHKARLKPDEPVFVRQPEGHFECIGQTDGNAQLPDIPISL